MPCFKEVSGGFIAKDFTVHMVEVVGGGIAIALRNFCHTMAFGEMAANEAVCIFVGATFARTIRMAIVDLLNQLFQTVISGKLAAIVHGDGLEGAGRERLTPLSKIFPPLLL